MFRSQGAARSHRQNRVLAGYLAFVGGLVNSAGFFLIGSFTSHVTGNVGRLANDLATGDTHAALFAATMVAAFFGGAFAASMILETNAVRVPYAYGAALLTEAGLLVVFLSLAGLTEAEHAVHARARDAEAAILCAAMGLQNSLVTRLSGAVVRTTHLTGVVTDLGIEAARWFRYWRAAAADRVHVRLALGKKPAERPLPAKMALLGTIATAFLAGAVAGATLVSHLGARTLLFPAAAVALLGAYAFATGRRITAPEGRP